MSNRLYPNEYLKSFQQGLTFIQAQFTVDSTQTATTANFKVSGLTGNGVANVALVGTGIYKVSLTNEFFRMLQFSAFYRGPAGTPVAIASLAATTPYVVSTVGTSAAADWTIAGVNQAYATAGVAVGLAFVSSASSASATGTGFAAPVITSGISTTQVYGNPNLTIKSPSPTVAPYFLFQTLYTATGPILAPATPVDGTVLYMSMLFRNSGMNSYGIVTSTGTTT